MAITEEQFNKLPKYARDEIERMRDTVRAKQDIINSISAQQKPTKIRVDRRSGGERFVDYLNSDYGVEFILPSEEGDKAPDNVVVVRVVKHPVLGDRLEIMATGYPHVLHMVPQSSNVIHISTARY